VPVEAVKGGKGHKATPTETQEHLLDCLARTLLREYPLNARRALLRKMEKRHGAAYIGMIKRRMIDIHGRN